MVVNAVEGEEAFGYFMATYSELGGCNTVGALFKEETFAIVKIECADCSEKTLTFKELPHRMATLFGAIAQLGERLHGMQEVSGSIPLSSTKKCEKL